MKDGGFFILIILAILGITCPVIYKLNNELEITKGRADFFQKDFNSTKIKLYDITEERDYCINKYKDVDKVIKKWNLEFYFDYI